MTTQEIIDLVSQTGHSELTIEFSGGGDSGEFFPWWNNEYQHNHPLTKLAESIVNDTGVDWWNNEGGGGYVTFSVTPPHITLNLVTYSRYVYEDTDVDDAYLDNTQQEDN